MINLKKLNFAYGEGGEVNSLKNINLNIKPGECIVLCGSSGCGKTTITRLINGLVPNFHEGNISGEVLLNNENLSNMSLFDISKKIGSVFQNPRSQFFNVDTTSEIAFGCENHGIPKNEILNRLDDVCRIFNIEYLLDRNIFKLSGGEKQKIACVSVYATYPNIFVLDEPSSNLDLKSIKELKGILEILKSLGKTIIIAEHRLYFLRDIADRVIYMDKGSVKGEYTLREFKEISDLKRREMGLRTLYPEKLKLKPALHSDVGDDIEVRNLEFSYRDKKALSIDNLKIKTKQVVAIIGHNGAGKSTFVRCLCGLEKKCKGKIIHYGKALSYKERIEKSYIVMQDVNRQLFTESVKEEILLSVKDEGDVNNVLEKLDLKGLENRHPQSLSGGQKQRVTIAASLVAGKDYIVLDEPTSGLDYRQMVNTSKVLNELREKAKLVLVVTHDFELIMECCSYIIHIEKGRVKDSYPLDEKGVDKIKEFLNV